MHNFKKNKDKANEHEQREAERIEDLREQALLISAYRTAEERDAVLGAIVDSSDDAIISKDLNGIITSWNKSAERIFGYKASEMIGASILILIPEDRQEEEPSILLRLRNGERIDHFETRRMTKSGKLIDVSLTISPIKDAEGRVIGVSKIARDITEKKLEEQRKHDFIAIVSHELKTPLTSVKSYIQMALARAKEREDRFSENVLGRAEVQTRKMATMIHDFLDMSRLEEGKMTLSASHFSLTELMDEVISDILILAPEHLIEYKGCPDVRLYADRDKIAQIIVNLLNNAAKYSAAGSTIKVECLLEQDQVHFSFTDQGAGIPEADQKRLFERFYRVDNAVTRKISGFGIGLYLVSEILKLHGSEIKLVSAPGEGSVFSFSLRLQGV